MLRINSRSGLQAAAARVDFVPACRPFQRTCAVLPFLPVACRLQSAISQGRVPPWRMTWQKIGQNFCCRPVGHKGTKLGGQRHQLWGRTVRAELGDRGDCEVNTGHAAAAWVQPRALQGDSAVNRLDRSGRIIFDRPCSATSLAMTSKQNIEGALLLDEVPLKRCHDRLAVINRQADATVDQVAKVLLDFELEPATSRDFVRTLNTDFPAHPASPLPRLTESRARFGQQYTPGS